MQDNIEIVQYYSGSRKPLLRVAAKHWQQLQSQGKDIIRGN